MKDESVFEQFLEERLGHLRMQPSDKVWDTILSRLKSYYAPRFNYPLILAWTFIFLNLTLPLNKSVFDLNFPFTTFISDGSISAAKRNHKAGVKEINSPVRVSKKISAQAGDESDKKLSASTKSDFSFIVLNPISTSQTLSSNERNKFLVRKKPTIPVISYLHKPVSKNNEINPKLSVVEKSTQKFNDNHKNKRLGLYFTPSLSYRILYIDNRPYFNNNGADAESSVSHFPATGFETGVSLINPLSKRWNFKSGIQINFSRYNINASKSNTELVFVSTSQNTGFERMTNIRNGDGQMPKKLMNENLQISLPFGLEYAVAGNQKWSVNMAGTIQPSFSIYAGGYMITTNYKNYIPADNLFRRYNVLTGFELFAKTNIGGLDLQAGPQVRYQLLTNTIGSYPVKEHLIDYGFKVGIIKKID